MSFCLLLYVHWCRLHTSPDPLICISTSQPYLLSKAIKQSNKQKVETTISAGNPQPLLSTNWELLGSSTSLQIKLFTGYKLVHVSKETLAVASEQDHNDSVCMGSWTQSMIELNQNSLKASLIPRQAGGGGERALGTHCLHMRLIATKFRGDRVRMRIYV